MRTRGPDSDLVSVLGALPPFVEAVRTTPFFVTHTLTVFGCADEAPTATPAPPATRIAAATAIASGERARYLREFSVMHRYHRIGPETHYGETTHFEDADGWALIERCRQLV